MKYSKEEKPCGWKTGGRAERAHGSMRKKRTCSPEVYKPDETKE